MTSSTLKFLLIVFLLSFIAEKNIAQSPYVPFPEGEAVWHVAIKPQYSLLPYHDQYMYQGDTSFNGFIYHKIDYKTESVHLPEGYLVYVDEGTIGYLRQDSLARRVYFVQKDFSQEYLLYDFSLQTGDTFQITSPFGWASGQYILGAKDSIAIGSDFRTVFILFPLFGAEIDSVDTVKMIEGIGFTSGLLTPAFTFCFENCIVLACFQQDGETLYSPCEYCFNFFSAGFCHVVGINEIGNTSAFSLHPNPVFKGSGCTLDNFSSSKIEVTVYDKLGNVIWKQNTRESQILIPTNNLSSEVYLVKISGDNEFFSVQKLVVE